MKEGEQYYIKGRKALFDDNDPAEAINLFSKALELGCGDYNVYCYNFRGVAYGYFNDHRRAVVNYEMALKVDPSCFLTYYNRSISYNAIGEYKKALNDITKYIEEENLNDEEKNACYRFRGELINILEEEHEEIGTNEDVLEFQKVAINASYLYFNKNWREEAIESVSNYIEQNREDYRGYVVRGKLLIASLDYASALSDLEQAYNMNDDDIAIFEDMGYALFKLGREDEATKYSTWAIERNSKNKWSYFIVGLYFASREDYRKTIEYNKKAILIDCNFAEAFLNLGIAYYAMSQTKEAKENIAKALNLGLDGMDKLNAKNILKCLQ